MKKIILFVLLFCLLPFCVKAENKGPSIVYDIESVEVDGDDVTASGWAFVDGIHTIGGYNYKIRIIAVRNKNEGDEGNTDEYNYLNGKYRDEIIARSIVIEEDVYSGENDLYPSTCFKTDSDYYGNRYCIEVYYGYYTNVTNRTGGKGSIVDASYASCKGDKSSCIHYNPRFSVTFSVSDLTDIFKGAEFTFLIEIEYKKYDENKIYYDGETGLDKNKHCYYKEEGEYNSNTCNILEKGSTSYVLTKSLFFSDTVIKNSDDFWELFKNIDFEVETKFNVLTEYGLYRGDDLEDLTFGIRSNFESKEHIIVDSELKQTGDFGTGLDSTNIMYYKLCLNNDGTAVDGAAADLSCPHTAWIAGSLGEVTGNITIIFPNQQVSNEPNNICEVDEQGNPCRSSSYLKKCRTFKAFSFPNKEYKDGVLYKDVVLDKIKNVIGDKLQINDINVGKMFKTHEKAELKNWNVLKGSPGLGLSIKYYYSYSLEDKSDEQQDNEQQDNEQQDNKLLFVLDYSLENGETGIKYISEEQLKHYGIIGDYDIIVLRDHVKTEFENFIDFFSNGTISEDLDNLNYDFPNSNNVHESISDLNYLSCFFANGSGECTSNYAYISKNGQEFLYGHPVNVDDYEYLGQKYFIPYNGLSAKDDEKKFIASIEFESFADSESVILENICELEIVEGPLENLRYRVIDLNDPFPNNEPEENGWASNWFSFWNEDHDILINNNNILKYRYWNKGIEYKVKLDSNAIKEIRDHNAKLYGNDGELNSSYLYINSNINNDGESEFIKTYLDGNSNNYNIEKYDLGVGAKG